ncbi:hypothetical protein K4K52_012618 [Colletotrichum sp. SAR 10_76]|nr:hypothetical protein K4K52_012618 [Colletotrichum sp. SAR 10_76]
MFSLNSALNPASVAKRQRPELPSPRHEERACIEVPEDDEMADATEDLDFRFHDIDTEPGTRARKAPVPREVTDNDDDFEHDARAPWQRRKRIRETIKEASLTLSECYREEANLLARLESARQKLEESIDPQGSKRINYPPRVRRERVAHGD